MKYVLGDRSVVDQCFRADIKQVVSISAVSLSYNNLVNSAPMEERAL
ncbi:hypothetical protein [Photobacterium leiognathi]|nr:hypothetical protein [Photobacterium leiognathi]